MTIECSEHDLENEYNLVQEDIGRDCPECNSGELVFKGKCPDCMENIAVDEIQSAYRCPNCSTPHTFKQLLRIR